MHHPWKAPIWIQGILIYLFQSPKNGCLTLTLNLKMNLAVGVPVKLLRSCKQGQIRTTHKRVDSLELDKYMHWLKRHWSVFMEKLTKRRKNSSTLAHQFKKKKKKITMLFFNIFSKTSGGSFYQVFSLITGSWCLVLIWSWSAVFSLCEPLTKQSFRLVPVSAVPPLLMHVHGRTTFSSSLLISSFAGNSGPPF